MKRYYVYASANATIPYGGAFDTWEQADMFARMMYGRDHKASIRKEYEHAEQLAA